MTKSILQKLYESEKTVFDYQDLSIILNTNNTPYLRQIAHRYKQKNILIQIEWWLYTLKDATPRELACKLKKPSYISFETILQKENIIFQDYPNTITLASDNTYTKNIANKSYIFHKIKSSTLLNPLGLKNQNNYTIASPERAICDMIYLKNNINFDNTHRLDTKLLDELSFIYNKRTHLSIQKLIKNVRSQQA